MTKSNQNTPEHSNHIETGETQKSICPQIDKLKMFFTNKLALVFLGVLISISISHVLTIAKKESPDKTYPRRAVQRVNAKNIDNPTKATPSINTENPDNQIERVQRVINRVEKAMPNFENRIASYLKRNRNPFLENQILPALNLVKNNKNNPIRNFHKFTKHTPADKRRRVPLSFGQFFYNVENSDESNGISASFDFRTYTIYLNEDFDPNNDLDMLILSHELFHALDDWHIRLKNPKLWKHKYDFNHSIRSDKLVADAGMETKAYFTTVEILNVITNGKLKQDILKGKKINLNDLLKQLKARPDQLILLQATVELAQVYYKSGGASAKRPLPQAFFEYVIHSHKASGFLVIAQDRNGRYGIVR